MLKVFAAMQNNVLERRFEQERKALKSQINTLEKKLEGFRQELAATESALSVKDDELVALRNNLRELEELREMKEVLILSVCNIPILWQHTRRAHFLKYFYVAVFSV